MANNLTGNPITVDTFGADVTVSTVPLIVNAVQFHGNAATDKIILKDRNGKIAMELHDADLLHFAKPQCFSNPPYYLYTADQTITGAALLLIYV
jgi:hypothetical protein